jgi:phage terminase large subunit
MYYESIRKQVKEIKEHKQSSVIQHIKYNKEARELHFLHSNKIYRPFKTPKEFHNDYSRVKMLMGPYGSGKSCASWMHLIMRAIEMPQNEEGWRLSKDLVIRNTMGELKTTTIPILLSWTQGLGSFSQNVSPVLTYKFQFNDGNGHIQWEILFLGLDILKDIGKLRSLDITNAWLNEAAFIHELIFDDSQARIGRYPYGKKNFNYEVIIDSNPPTVRHWIYRKFEKENIKNFAIYHQPAGILKEKGNYIPNPEADNIENLPGGYNYYLDIARSHSEEYVQVYCRGEYGKIASGKVVFNEYNDDLHAIDKIEYIEEVPIVLGWDFGLTPAVIFLQRIDKQIRAFKEFCLERGGIKQFVELVVLPYIQSLDEKVLIEASIGDISGDTPSQTDMQTCLGILRQHGITTQPAKSNTLQPRLESVRTVLNTLVNGKPAFILSKKETPILREGFLGEYFYKSVQVAGSDEIKDIPYKTHPYSDIQDALQYAIMYYLAIDNTIKVKNPLLDSKSVWI